jgi:hypothetical protein
LQRLISWTNLASKYFCKLRWSSLK